MIDACDAVVLLRDWETSEESKIELSYACGASKPMPVFEFEAINYDRMMAHLEDLKDELKIKADNDKDKLAIEDYKSLKWAISVINSLSALKYDYIQKALVPSQIKSISSTIDASISA